MANATKSFGLVQTKKHFDEVLTKFDKQFCSIPTEYYDETLDIASAVTELITKMLDIGLKIEIREDLSGDQTLTFDGRFKDLFVNARLVPVGSFSEGTKTVSPDEFDFMFVFSVGNFKLVHGCGPDKLRLVSEENGFWQQFLGEKFNIKSLGYHSVHHHLDNMMHLVEKQIQLDKSFVEITRASGILKYCKLTDQRLDLVWISETLPDKLQITVDIMPSIECSFDDIKPFLLDSKFPDEYSTNVREDGCCLVPKACGYRCRECFQISLAATEKRLMADISFNHKMCYRILKKAFSMAQKFPHAGEYIDLTSYKMKNAILHHVYEGKCNEKLAVHQCLNSILEFLMNAYKNVSLPMFLLRDKCCLSGDDNTLFVYVLDSITTADESEAVLNTPNKGVIWFEFNWRLLQLFQIYINCFVDISSFTATQFNEFVDILKVSIQTYILQHDADYPRIRKKDLVEGLKSSGILFIPIIFAIEHKISTILGFQAKNTFPCHQMLIDFDNDHITGERTTVSNDQNVDNEKKYTLLYDRKQSNENSYLSYSIQRKSFFLSSHSSNEDNEMLLVMDLSSDVFTISDGENVYSKDAEIKTLKCKHFILNDIVSQKSFKFNKLRCKQQVEPWRKRQRIT